MSPIPARVTTIEQPGVQYQVVVEIVPKYRGSFNTLVFGEKSRTAVRLEMAGLTWSIIETPALT
jgi:hypothetical protein